MEWPQLFLNTRPKNSIIMFQKTVEREKPYSKTDIAELKKIGREIKEAKKNPEYRRAIDNFIKATT
ncbi:MAG: hypothetical protein QT03_C0001G0996 [archaeon GW2011_AR10]|nr:MAG: hypothetical protein QT03_C0001G0996 [archaeon GW2011_AR10]